LLVPGDSKETAENLLERLGKAFLHYRSYGRNGRAAGAQALQWFRRDHDEMLKVATGEVRKGQAVIAPERAVFGLPHNYFFSSIPGAPGKVDVNGDGAERRASPLFFHVHHLGDHPPIAILAFLPATFLRSGRLAIRHVNNKIIATPTLPDTPDLWQPIHEFFYELHQGNLSRLAARFPGTVEVNP
jgi:CRISPR-associated protein Cmr1